MIVIRSFGIWVSSNPPVLLMFSLICISYPYSDSTQESNTVVMIHDAFQPVNYWNGFMPPNKYDKVFLDTHIYQVFSDGVREFPSLSAM